MPSYVFPDRLQGFHENTGNEIVICDRMQRETLNRIKAAYRDLFCKLLPRVMAIPLKVSLMVFATPQGKNRPQIRSGNIREGLLYFRSHRINLKVIHVNNFSSLSRMIFLCSSAATAISVSASFCRRVRKIASISSELLPVAQTMKMKPKRCS